MFWSSSVRHQERFVQAVFADLVCGTTLHTTRHVQPCRVVRVLPHLRIQLVQNAPDDGPMRSETRPGARQARLYQAAHAL